MALTVDEAKEILKSSGQEHVLNYIDKLSGNEQKTLLEQIDSIDFSLLKKMQEALIASEKKTIMHNDIRPADVIVLSKEEFAEASKVGANFISAGKVGALLVAGGQGSRLGFNGPKGAYKIGPISGASLFEIHSRKILALERKYNTTIPFYIMTSRANNTETINFFKENNFFGLSPDNVMFFTQGMCPALTKDGKIILDRPGHIFMSPDGHGGIISAMKKTGVFDDMKRRGLESLYYFQVDNPLLNICEPSFIGKHLLENADVSIKVCEKRDPDEPIGLSVIKNGRNAIVEYSEMTPEQMHEIGDDGRLRFLYGSVAIHVFSLEFLFRQADKDMQLHIAHKKVPYCDNAGETIIPKSPNAFKFEKFIFDVIPEADNVVNLAFMREDEFSPVKNGEGSDSPATAQRDMINKFAGWLQQMGVSVPLNEDGSSLYKIEIDPCYAVCVDDLKDKIDKNLKITADILFR